MPVPSASYALIPAPRRLEVEGEGDSHLVLEGVVQVSAPDAARAVVQRLSTRLWEGLRITLVPRAEDIPADDTSPVAIILCEDPALGPEEYTLDIGDRVEITAATSCGFSHAIESLLQLAGPEVYRRAAPAPHPLRLPRVRIADGPRFRWRGLMIDVARHFLPIRELVRIVDLMAMHRLNTLHLHLTDDQGWRIPIDAYPRLVDVGSWRSGTQQGADDVLSPEDGRPHGGHYTKAQLRELVAYAADRGIEVVPEIDVPGHSQAAIAAYPELGVPEQGGSAPTVEMRRRFGVTSQVLNMEESTVEFYRRVLDEVLEIFPSELIGLGGDECPSTAWERDPRSRELAEQRGLSSVGDLRVWFLGQLTEHLESHGRRLMAWDELLDTPNGPDATILAWRGQGGVRQALRAGFPVIACPDDIAYFDYRQSDDENEPVPVGVVVDVATVLTLDPLPPDADDDARALVLGGQANLWSEHLDTPRSVDYMLWPRACALAEALWHGPRNDVEEFLTRLESHLLRLDALGVEYRPCAGTPPWLRRPGLAGRIQTRKERDMEVEALTRAWTSP